ncbi:hypothetical protein NF212_03970 [Parasalinivibrio latis]|uniref:hypothetical protein n=1 Tax=Parasalinivibrio latis TaxID=2952610 RepID=UPI0030E4A0E1
MKKCNLAVLALAILVPTVISFPAQSGNSDEIRLRGFTSLAGRYLSDDSLGYHRSYQLKGATTHFSLTSDSILGLQANIPLGHDLESIIQVVYRDQISDSASDYIDWAVLRYQLNRQTSFRVGRTHTDIQFASDHQSVGYVHPWVSAPTEFYSAVNLFSRLDGFDIEFLSELGDGDIRLKGAFGQTSQKVKAGGINNQIDIRNSGYLTIGYSINNWKFRTSQAWINVDRIAYENQLDLTLLEQLPDTVWPGAKAVVNAMESTGEHISYTAAGLNYDNHNWFVQSEVSLTDSDWAVITPTVSGYFATGAYVNDLTVFASFARIMPTSGRKTLPPPNYTLLPPTQHSTFMQLYDGVVHALNANRADQFTASSGIRWDFKNNAALKLQYDFSRIKPGGAGLWTENAQREQSYSVHGLTLMLDMVF